MIVLADNDIIRKLAQCDLLDSLPTIFGQDWNQIFITPTAKHWLLPKVNDKALRKCGNQETVDRIKTFLEKTTILQAVKDTALLAKLVEMDGIHGDGGGEQLLFAAAVELENPLVITGDRTALRAVLANKNIIPSVFSALENSVVTFETALMLSMNQLGFAIVKSKILASPLLTASKPDGMLRFALKSETSKDDFTECLCSYSNEVISLLAFKSQLPPVLNITLTD